MLTPDRRTKKKEKREAKRRLRRQEMQESQNGSGNSSLPVDRMEMLFREMDAMKKPVTPPLVAPPVAETDFIETTVSDQQPSLLQRRYTAAEIRVYLEEKERREHQACTNEVLAVLQKYNRGISFRQLHENGRPLGDPMFSFPPLQPQAQAQNA